MEEHKQNLLKHFENNEKINEVMLSVKDLISTIKRDNSNSVSHLSVNSKEDKNYKFNDEQDDFGDEVINMKKVEELVGQKDELEEINRQLNKEV